MSQETSGCRAEWFSPLSVVARVTRCDVRRCQRVTGFFVSYVQMISLNVMTCCCSSSCGSRFTKGPGTEDKTRMMRTKGNGRRKSVPRSERGHQRGNGEGLAVTQASDGGEGKGIIFSDVMFQTMHRGTKKRQLEKHSQIRGTLLYCTVLSVL